jgi:hypothetical protein
MTIVRRRTRCGASSLRCYRHILSRPPSETAVGVSCMDGLRCVMGEEEHTVQPLHNDILYSNILVAAMLLAFPLLVHTQNNNILFITV